MPFEASRPITAIIVWLLPEPDSPTIGDRLAGATSMSMPCTASTAPSGVRKRTCRSLTLRIGSGVAMSAIPISAVPRVERVAQAVADEVQGEQRRDEEEGGEDQQPVALPMFLAPSEISTPQLVIGSCTPRPRKDRKLSSRITCGTSSVMKTTTGPRCWG